MTVAEYTDIDGDALALTSDSRGLWVTCTTDDAEVTVGPFPPETLNIGTLA